MGGKGEVVRNTWGVGGVLGGTQPAEVFRGCRGWDGSGTGQLVSLTRHGAKRARGGGSADLSVC